MSKPNKVSQVLSDFPLESQREDLLTSISINPIGLLIMQQDEEGGSSATLLTKNQVIEVIRLCQGRIIGALTNCQVKTLSILDQSIAILREQEALIHQLSQGGEPTVIDWLTHETTENPAELVHGLAVITDFYLKDSAVFMPEEPSEDPDPEDSDEEDD